MESCSPLTEALYIKSVISPKCLQLEASQPPVAIAIVVIGMNWTSRLIPDNVDADMKTFQVRENVSF